MKTIRELMRGTPRDVRERAGHVSVHDIKVTHAVRKALKAMVFEAKCRAITETVLYDIMVELYPYENQVVRDPEQTGNQPRVFEKPSLDVDAWVRCSCPYFLFHCEWALAKVGSSSIHYSNGKPPHITNKNFVPFLCKHLFAAAPPIIQLMVKATQKDPRGTYNYV